MHGATRLPLCDYRRGRADGREVELRVDGGYLQWKYDTDPDTGVEKTCLPFLPCRAQKATRAIKATPARTGRTAQTA